MEIDLRRNTEEEDDGIASLHGVILELVLTHVALVDLVPVRHVSDAWKHAVTSSLRHFNRPKPWLWVHSQTTRSPYTTAVRAYDPRSDVWVDVGSGNHASSALIRAPHSGLLYTFSHSQLCFSLDPLHLAWNHAPVPIVWRADPIVAAVGRSLVVAGGGCDFDDDPFAVEIYDLDTQTWESCDEMPSALRDCSASDCISVAVAGDGVYVMEKSSGLTHFFDPKAKKWRGPYNPRPDRGGGIYFSVIEFIDGDLILIGLEGDAGVGKTIKIWKIGAEMSSEPEQVAEMPPKLMEELEGEGRSCIPSFAACSAGSFLYLYDPSVPEKVFWCDLEHGKWGSVRSPATDDRSRVVFSSSNVGIRDLERAMASENRTFSVMETTEKS